MAGLDAAIVATMTARLEELRLTGVRVVSVIESGQRAWGFPFPDTDGDCRLVYPFPADRYLGRFPPRPESWRHMLTQAIDQRMGRGRSLFSARSKRTRRILKAAEARRITGRRLD